MNYCRLCVTPDTRPFIRLDAAGVCNACRTHHSKTEIDWEAREQSFRAVVARAKSGSTGYDCVIPVSGGKDSTWQVIQCLKYGLKPLAVTWKSPARTAVGQANLSNLINLGVDHVDYQISPKVEARFLDASLRRCGSTAIPMHFALFAIPLKIAARFRIPLVVWGENSAFEYGSDDDAQCGFRLDADWLRKFGVTNGTTIQDWFSDALSPADLTAYTGSSPAELETAGVIAVFLGYYFSWDPVRSLKVARDHGFRSRPEGPKTGYYDYADIDDDFISIHHFLKWYKFGFTRLFDNLSLEIRNGRLNRAEATELIRARGEDTPYEDIETFCEFVGMTRAQFFEVIERFRNRQIWTFQGGKWTIPDFIIPDWAWS